MRAKSFNPMERIGEKVKQNNGQNAFLIYWENADDIIILFEDGTYCFEKRYGAFKKGEIKNPYFPTVFGVGCLGNAKSKVNGKELKSHDVWEHMMMRCYYEPFQEQNPTYKGVKVCKEWQCYENFQKWFDKNWYEVDGEQMCLDKDILNKGSRIYSPKNCIFVPRPINELFKNYSKETDLPRGVSWNKHAKKYEAYIHIDSKRRHLGRYNTIEEAEQVYIQARKERILELANYYKDKIPKKLYDALLNYCI